MPPVSRLLAVPVALALILPPAAFAASQSPPDNGGWSGSGQFGFAMAQGNSHTQNMNAQLTLKLNTTRWKDKFYLTALRSKGDVTVIDPATGDTITQYSTTANRYEGGASVGYKFDPRNYLVTAGRYSHDDFAADRWQEVLSIGYGHIVFKNDKHELSFEVGPGFKRYQPAYTTTVHLPVQREAVVRTLVNWKRSLTANTKLQNTLLSEFGAKNKYYQDDLALSISMSKNLAVKLGYEVRYNSSTPPGTRHTDQLYTTNLVYNF